MLSISLKNMRYKGGKVQDERVYVHCTLDGCNVKVFGIQKDSNGELKYKK